MDKDNFTPFVRQPPGIPTADVELLRAEKLHREGQGLGRETITPIVELRVSRAAFDELIFNIDRARGAINSFKARGRPATGRGMPWQNVEDGYVTADSVMLDWQTKVVVKTDG